MTAINVIVRPDSATVITDTKASTPFGGFNVSKVFPIPHMRVAVATMGPIAALGRVATLISSSAIDFDSARIYLAGNYATLDLDDADICVVGISQRGPAAFRISKVNTNGMS